MPQIQNVSPDLPQALGEAVAANAPQIYANGFINGLGTADIVIIAQRNNTPVAVMNLSYTAAKTLAVALGQLIAHLEQHTGREMLTTQEVADKLLPKAASEESKK